MHETLIEELTKQIYERSLPTSSLQRGSQMRLSRKDASVWGWSDGMDSPRRMPSMILVNIDALDEKLMNKNMTRKSDKGERNLR